MSELDICVLTAGQFDLLEKCLDSIQQELQGFPKGFASVYVLDNGSPKEDRMKTQVFKHPVVTRYSRSNHNLGYPAGANQVIGMGKSPLVLFVSDDIVFHSGAIASLLLTMADRSIGLCGLKLLFAEGSKGGPSGKVQHVGHSVNLRAEVVHPLMGWSADNPKCCISREVISVTGATFMVRRDAFQRVGGFSSDYGKGYYEDVEMALHIKAAGYKIWVDCNAVADHWVGATFEQRKHLETPQLAFNKNLFLSRNQRFMRWTDWDMR